MNTMIWRTWVIVISILSVLIAMLTGCRHTKGAEETVLSPIETEITATPLPDGITLKNLYITHQGMRSGSHYILYTTENGIYMKITDKKPSYWNASVENDAYFAFADIVMDGERASLARLSDETPIRALEQAIADAGALAWDGFYKRVAMPDVADSGDRYILYLVLSDGTTVAMDSYNAEPAGFSQLLYQAEKIFHENRDYSHYQITDFDASPCVKLYVCFRRSFGKGEWRLELHRSDNRWIVVLMDPDGWFVPEGTEIADYGDSESALPFDRFLALFKSHGLMQWNGYDESDGASKEYMDIRLYFEDGKEFTMRGSAFPAETEAFRKAIIDETLRFYTEYIA